MAYQRHGEMLVEGYSVLEIKSLLIGYTRFFHKSAGQIAILDASINPLNTAAMDAATS